MNILSYIFKTLQYEPTAVRSPVRQMLTRVILLASIFILIPGAYADKPSNISHLEYMSLPDYCMPKLGYIPETRTEYDPWNSSKYAAKNSYRVNRWKKVLGAGYRHIHHYCWGLIIERRAEKEYIKTGNISVFRAKLGYALGNYQYVLERAQKGFILLPKLYSAKARIFVRLAFLGGLNSNMLTEKYKLIEKAEVNYKKAIAANKKYLPGYVGLAKLYVKLDRKDDARDILKAAEKLYPNSKTVKRRLRKLNNHKISAGDATKPTDQE